MAETSRSTLSRTAGPVLAVMFVYLVSAAVGMFMAHAGNGFALSWGDRLVADAQGGSVMAERSPIRRAVADFGGNLKGATTDAVLGLGIVLPAPLIVYRGWVGGIVSVDGRHRSRLARPKQAAYYLSALLLQVLGFSLAAGAGIHAGLSAFRARPKDAGFFWYRISEQALFDAAKLFALAVPVLFIASLWEFLSPWN